MEEIVDKFFIVSVMALLLQQMTCLGQENVRLFMTFSFPSVYNSDTETYGAKVISGVHTPAYEITMPASVKGWFSCDNYVDVAYKFNKVSYICTFLDVLQPYYSYNKPDSEENEEKVVCIDRDMIKEYMNRYPIDSLVGISQPQADSIFLWRFGKEPLYKYLQKNLKSAHKRILKPQKYEKIRNKYKNAVLYKPPFLILLYQIKPEEFKYFKRYIGITIHDEDTTLPKSWIEVF
ncbi:MAG: hypothetical protein J6N92_02390 [Alloprevotella sp.]|nr:hypothetical protein [Alloprevotella sp.]